jgi:hypothetical protein
MPIELKNKLIKIIITFVVRQQQPPPHSDALTWGVGHLLVDGRAQVLG